MLESRELSTFHNVDKVGILCSGACAVHCMLIPILALASPSLAAYFQNIWIHVGLLLLVVPVAAFSFYRHQKIHAQKKPMMFGTLGVLFLVTAILLETSFHLGIRNLELFLTLIGSALLITGHGLNIKHLKRCMVKGVHE